MNYTIFIQNGVSIIINLRLTFTKYFKLEIQFYTWKMENYSMVAQIVVALSIGFVWIFRFDNIVKEFNQYGLSNSTRTIVGAIKIVLSTLLIAGIWYPSLVLVPALLMAFLMCCAQYFHFKVNNSWYKHAPSFLLLLLCLYIAAVSQKIIQ